MPDPWLDGSRWHPVFNMLYWALEDNSMDKTASSPPTTVEGVELEAAVDQLIAEIKRTHERMQSIQERTERLGAETRAMIEQLKAL
jgi:hypothetical protein